MEMNKTSLELKVVTSFNNEKLISLVHVQPSLWNKKIVSSRQSRAELWAQIAEEMGKDVDTVRRKWDNIRDVFRRQLLKDFSKWPHFKSMLFLKDVTHSKYLTDKSDSNHSDVDDSNISYHNEIDFPQQFIKLEKSDSDIECETNLIEINESVPPDETEFSPPPKRIKVVNSHENSHENKTAAQNKGKNSLSIEDSDYHFALSLVPFMRVVPDSRKLEMRMKLMKLLQEESKTALQS